MLWIGLSWKRSMVKKLDVWKGGSLSMAGRTTLINVSLVNSTIYHMSMYLMPKTVIKRLDKSRRKFFWQGGELKEEISSCDMAKSVQMKKERWLGDKKTYGK
jgi:hypothetical protein